MASWTGYGQEGLSDMSEEATIDEDAFEGWNGMLDALNPAIFKGTVNWLSAGTGVFEPAPELPVQITIEWARNGTLALETVDVLTAADGTFEVGQFLLPEDLIRYQASCIYFVFMLTLYCFSIRDKK